MSDTGALRSFPQFLTELEDGQLGNDLIKQVQEIVAAMNDAAMNGRGKSSAKLAIKVNFKLEGGVIEVAADYTATLPKAPRGRSIFWATPENNLSRRDPRQSTLALRDVTSGQAGTIRTV